MNKKQNIKQNINVTGSSNVKIEQIAGDKKNHNYKTHIPPKTTQTDVFFIKHEITIEKLAEKFSTYINVETPITKKSIKKWLLQFGDTYYMNLALKLLNNIDYYNAKRMKDIFEHFLNTRIPDTDKPNIVLSLFGGLKDSPSMINYLVGEITMKNKLEQQPLEVILDKMNPNKKIIVFVDDNVSSGKQATQIIQDWLGIKNNKPVEHVKPLTDNQKEQFKKFKIYFCFFVGFIDNIFQNELKKFDFKNVAEIYSFTKLEESIGCFHKASTIFEPQERIDFMNLVEKIGIQLLQQKKIEKNWPDKLVKERSLGYGNSQKLIVFFYNTPTSTLPILWEKGTYNGKAWYPLFPRREKK